MITTNTVTTNDAAVMAFDAPTIQAAILETASKLAEREIPCTATLNSLKDMGIDSIGIFQVICEVEQEFKISIPDTALQGDDITITQMAELIVKMHTKNSN